MITAVLAGCLVGAGLLAVVWRLLPLRASPVAELARYDAAQSGSPVTRAAGAVPASKGLARRQELVGRWAARQLDRRGMEFTTLRQDLALLGRTYEQTLGRKITLALTGLLLAAVVVGTLAQTGSALPTGFPLVLAVLLSVTMFWAPDLEARREAARRLGVAVASLWVNLVPFFAVLWSMAYGFMPNLYQIAGGLVALSGVVYMQWRKLQTMQR